MDGVKCEGKEQLAYHIHQHLFILVDGNPQTIPPYVGIPGAPLLTKCFYWLHTHDNSGVIHVESPIQTVYTLGQFFDIWGQPLSPTKIATHPVAGGNLMAYVNGQPYSGNPRDIPLRVHTQIVLEVGRSVAPPQFSFVPGL